MPPLSWRNAQRKCIVHRISRLQIQRVESTCVLVEGLVVRVREMYARAAELIAEQVAADDPVSPHNAVSGAFDGWECHENSTYGRGVATREGGDVGLVHTLGVIDQTFFFAMVWGLGGGLTGDSALAFDVYVRDLVQVC